MEARHQYIVDLIKRLESEGVPTSKWSIVDSAKPDINVISTLDVLVKRNVLKCENGQYHVIEQARKGGKQ